MAHDFRVAVCHRAAAHLLSGVCLPAAVRLRVGVDLFVVVCLRVVVHRRVAVCLRVEAHLHVEVFRRVEAHLHVEVCRLAAIGLRDHRRVLDRDCRPVLKAGGRDHRPAALLLLRFRRRSQRLPQCLP